MYEFESGNPVVITQFKWAGEWGPFRIQSRCDECDAITGTVKSMMEQEFKAKNVVFEVKPWLNNIFYCLTRGVWHAPILTVNGKKFFQISKNKSMFSRAELIATVEEVLAQQKQLAIQAAREMEHRHIRLSYNKVEELIYAGNNLCCQKQFDEELLAKGIFADISLEAERLDNPKGVKYFFWFPWVEDTAPPFELIEMALNVVDELLRKNVKMYIHCRNGHGRTTTFLASYYIRRLKVSAEQALNIVREKRPSGHLNERQKAFLREYADRIRTGL